MKSQCRVLPGWTACNGGGRKPAKSLCKLQIVRPPVNCVVQTVCGHVPRNPHVEVHH